MGGRQSLFSLLVLFVREHLKPMSELPMSAVFVYSDARAFAEDMFPPTAGKMRSRFLNANSFLKERATALGVSSVSSVGDENENEIEVEEEAMGCIYDVYSDCSAMYVNLHDAYVAFKQRFDGSDDEEEEAERTETMKKKAEKKAMERAERKKKKEKAKRKKNQKKGKGRKGRKSKKEEMSEDDTDSEESEESDEEVDLEEDRIAVVNVKKTEREKLTQINFRMSIDDLKFCGFLQATKRKQGAMLKMAELI